ncbi:hypothetical protein FJT64_019737 [Amphibalanus amphitrite]|uniref:Uncharacterized protein n=1 Tax=Amphibalanus amphitrite TaxID=1232801 RepID=A0A6A4WQN6_AMPAM|nr:hypothetical protein FJT64_019737 [Amphibalanus amphitrite]
MEIDQEHFRVVAVNACRTAPEGSAGRLLSLLDQLRLPDAGALPDWGLHPGHAWSEQYRAYGSGAAAVTVDLARAPRHWGARRADTDADDYKAVQQEDFKTWSDGFRIAGRGRQAVPAETLVGLQNLLVHLRDVSAENAHLYQYRLWDAKRIKVETAQNRGVSPDGAAGYRDGLRRASNGHPLSAEEVQKAVSRVNQLSS